MASNEKKKKARLDEERWMSYYHSVVDEGCEVMYHVTKALYKGGNSHPVVYCKNNISCGEDFYLSRFNQDQRKLLESWPVSKPYDVSKASTKWDIPLHYVFLLHMCGVSDKCFRVLKSKLLTIKKHRDAVSHGFTVLSQTELTQNVYELEKVYSSILVFLSGHCLENFDAIQNIISSKLHNRLYETTGYEHSESHKEWNIKETQNALKELYSKKRYIIPAEINECKAVTVVELFQPRSIVIAEGESNILSSDSDSNLVSNRHSLCTGEDSEFNSVPRQYTCALGVDKLILHMAEHPSAEHLIITGPAGCGKSTLLQYILDQYCSGSTSIEGLDKMELILYVDLKSTQASTISSLMQKELLKETCLNVPMNYVLSKIQERTVVWLLDNFDETSADTRSLTEEIIQKASLVISTSRRESLQTLKNYKDAHTLVGQFEPLSLESAKDLARKVVAIIGNNISFDKFEKEYLRNELEKSGFNQCLLSSPSEITRLCFLWVKKPEIFLKIKSRSELRHELLSMKIEDLIDQINRKVKGTRREIRKRLLNWLNKLCEIVWLCRLHDVKYVSEWHIKCLFTACVENKLAEAKTDLISAFLEMKDYSGCNILGSTDMYVVPDSSLVDHLAALYLYGVAVDKPGVFPKYLLDKLNPIQPQNKKFAQIFVNLIGILSMKGQLHIPFLTVALKILSDHGFSEWLDLLQEGQCNQRLTICIADMFANGFGIGNEDLSFRWKPLLSLLLQKKITHMKVLLNYAVSDLEELVSQVSVICDYVETICIHNEWSFNAFGKSEVDDKIISTVKKHKTCRLVCFSGYLSPYAIDRLIPTSIKSLDLRLKNTEQVMALQRYLWEYQPNKLCLLLDFPHTLYPGELCRLDINKVSPECKDDKAVTTENPARNGHGNPDVDIDEKESDAQGQQKIPEDQNHKKSAVEHLIVSIPRISDGQIYWATRVLQNITDCMYDRVFFIDSQVTVDGCKHLLESVNSLKLHIPEIHVENNRKVRVLQPMNNNDKRRLKQKQAIRNYFSNVVRSVEKKVKNIVNIVNFVNFVIILLLILAAWKLKPELCYAIYSNVFFTYIGIIGLIGCVILIGIYKCQPEKILGFISDVRFVISFLLTVAFLVHWKLQPEWCEIMFFNVFFMGGSLPGFLVLLICINSFKKTEKIEIDANNIFNRFSETRNKKVRVKLLKIG